MLSNWHRHSVCKCCLVAHDGQGDKNRCSYIAGTFRVWMEEDFRANWGRQRWKGDTYLLLNFIFLRHLSTHWHLIYCLLRLAQHGGMIEKHSDATSLRNLKVNSSSPPLSLIPLPLAKRHNIEIRHQKKPLKLARSIYNQKTGSAG